MRINLAYEKNIQLHMQLLITDKVQRTIDDGQFSRGIFLDFFISLNTIAKTAQFWHSWYSQ